MKTGGVEDQVASAKLDVGDAGFLHELVSSEAPPEVLTKKEVLIRERSMNNES